MIGRSVPWPGTLRAWLAVTSILGITLGLMWAPMHNDTPTVDETVFLGAGYSYWQGHRYYLNPEHPPLMQLWSALPLEFMKVNWPTTASEFFDDKAFWTRATTWEYRPEPLSEFKHLPDPYYHYPAFEGGLFGRVLLYGAQNDVDKLVFWGRFMQALVMLATGVMVFLWARSLSNLMGGLLALVTWCFNPLALAYGHLIITDPGIALTLPLAVWTFSRFLDSPGPRTASLAGLACGAALLTKYTAVILIPIYGVLGLVAWWRERRSIQHVFLPNVCLFAAIAWGTVLLLYIPYWLPPPPILAENAQRLDIPAWFTRLRWLLIPREYFKGLTIMLIHVRHGHDAYLFGQWSDKGWWYYYPFAILVKTPLALLLLLVSATAMALWRISRSSFTEAAPLLAAAVYLGCAATSKADIGIRHILPIYPLLAVVIGIEYARAKPPMRLVAWLLAVWLVVAACMAHADYIAYFNEIVGGPSHGQNYLVDSNFDWGQDGKLLQQWMETNHVGHVYLDYFGTGLAIDHLQISSERVKSADVRNLSDGYVVISASRLMTGNYDWLRATRTPVARIGNTLFVYSLPTQ